MKTYIFKTLNLTRKIIYLTLYMIDLVFKRKNRIVILCYHSFEVDNWRFSVPVSILKWQIEHFLKSGYKFITLKDIENHLNGIKILDDLSVVVTIDDGYKNVKSAKKIFKNYGIRPTIFVLSRARDVNRKEIGCNLSFLNTNELIELKKEGWIIGCHSATHVNLVNLNRYELEREILEPKKSLEKELSCKIDYFAYPKGKYNLEVLDVVKKSGYKLGLTMDDNLASVKTDILKIPRVGVDKTHSTMEFRAIFSPSVVFFRKIVKGIISGIL